jgi:hypothetical protein
MKFFLPHQEPLLHPSPSSNRIDNLLNSNRRYHHPIYLDNALLRQPELRFIIIGGKEEERGSQGEGKEGRGGGGGERVG